MQEKIRSGVWYGMFAVFVAMISFFLLNMSHTLPENPVEPETRSFAMIIFVSVFMAPVLEEIIFRFFPIGLTNRYTKNKGVLWLVILGASVLFGYLHGGFVHIFMQGVTGIFYSAAYLRGGLISSVVAHATYNATLLLNIFAASFFVTM